MTFASKFQSRSVGRTRRRRRRGRRSHGDAAERGAGRTRLSPPTPRTTIPSTRPPPSPSRRATLLRMRRHLARRPTGKQEQRRLSVGAEPRADGTHFRVWAPSSSSVAVVLSEPGGRPIGLPAPLTPHEDGYFQGLVAGAKPGTLYLDRARGRLAVRGSSLAISAGGPARTVGGHRSARVRVDRRRMARPRRAQADRLRDARRHLHVRRHVCVGESRTGRPREARRVDRRGPATR